MLDRPQNLENQTRLEIVRSRDHLRDAASSIRPYAQNAIYVNGTSTRMCALASKGIQLNATNNLNGFNASRQNHPCKLL
eukprot:5073443-Pleurochrysis_carterae.AAC.2